MYMALLIIDDLVDIVLMDVAIPGSDGVEVARHGNIGNLKNVPVIMVTGNAEVSQIEKALEQANLACMTCSADKVELVARVQSALKLKQEIENSKVREKQLEDRNEQLLKLSSVDGLTGIANRRYFNEVLEREWRRSKREGQPLSVALADIDFFKNYNDTYGHLSGDDCIRKVAESIRNSLKRPGDMVARYGGEEFVVILPATDYCGSVQVSETIRLAIESLQLEHESSPIQQVLTVSVGVATVTPGNHAQMINPEQLLAIADQALYKAKHLGRNRVYHEGCNSVSVIKQTS